MLNSNDKQEMSRYDLKQQLKDIQSFDISAFGQSKNQSSVNNKSLSILNTLNTLNNQVSFPVVDAPTLEFLQDSQYNIRYLDSGKDLRKENKGGNKKYQDKKQKQYFEDLTARNHQNGSTTYQYEQKIQELSKQLEKTYQKLQRQKKQSKLLHQKISTMQQHHQKIIEQLKQKNKQQRDQMRGLKQRQIKLSRQKQQLQKQLNQALSKNSLGRDSRAVSTSSGNSIHSSTVLTTSYMEDPSYFCPQLLSPQQTVTLLSKLLKKVSKSSRMIKQLTDDSSVKTILNKIQKK